MPLFVSIALPLPLNEAFVYQLPPELEPLAETGRRALVPFGPRMLTGIIVGVADNPGAVPPARIRNVQDIPDDEPVFDSHMMQLSGWIADYYLSSLGETLKTALPGGSLTRSRTRVLPIVDVFRDSGPVERRPDNTAFCDSGENGLTGNQNQVMRFLTERGPCLLRKLQSELGAGAATAVRTLERKGFVRLEREMTAPAAKIKTERHIRPVPDADAIVSSRARKQAECLELLRNHPEGVHVGEFVERHGYSRGVLNSLVNAGLAVYEDVEVIRSSKILDQEPVRTDHPLTREQTECLRLIETECGCASPRPILIHGVTGSGKTRIYIELVKKALERGKGAIILVPEIALTPQTVRFFSSVFPGRVAALHSAMSSGERFDMWRLIRDGARDVVIGPRSAIFAPLASPGVIIVDEEHDHSYKQTDTAPRYHARDVAVVRGSLLGIPVALGSATPSLESWRNALSGKYLLARLTARIDSRPLPDVQIVDMREEQKAGNKSSISRALREEITLRFHRREKSIVLINRRGFATGIRCSNCGQTLACPDCSAALVYHAARRLAVCHLCGQERIVLQHCPHCGSEDIMYTGRGTERIESELANAFEEAGIIRMDSDTTQAHDSHFRLLEEFRSGEASILLGTQMVGKGLDIPEVTLVGVIAADSALALPDFRAAEKTFQLITQVAGRAGRGEAPGKVIVQALMPEHYAVAAACRHDYETFAAVELESRGEVDFPPFTRLILIEMTAENSSALMAKASDAADYLTEHSPPETEVLGPVEAPVARIRGKYRAHILLKTRRITALRAIVRGMLDTVSGPEMITIDVDPVDMM